MIQFPIFVQPYTQQPLILYQIAMVPVPIVDQNKQANSYTHLQINSPYIALNSETYISIRQQELRTCRKIGYKFYCEELLVAKHKSKYNCECVIYTQAWTFWDWSFLKFNHNQENSLCSIFFPLTAMLNYLTYGVFFSPILKKISYAELFISVKLYGKLKFWDLKQ